MNDKNRKAMFAKKNNSSLSSKDIVSHQKKFGISTKGTVGLNRQKPREIREFNDAVNDLTKLNDYFKRSLKTKKGWEFETTFSHAMLGGRGGVKESTYDDAKSHFDVINDKFYYSGVNANDHEKSIIDQSNITRLTDKLDEVSSQLSDDWWYDQSGINAKENLTNAINEIDIVIADAKKLTKGF